MNNLLPAELVARLAEDESRMRLGYPPRELVPNLHTVTTVRHAWIVAAEWLEESAEDIFASLRKRYPSEISMATGNPQYEELRAAARELRKAAEEGREP